jgi:predicted nucleotidyltransferase
MSDPHLPGAGGPTADADVNALLAALVPGVRDALGANLVGAYLTGSLVAGDFDRASDVDVVVATERAVEGEPFAALDALHARLAARDLWCATQLEVTYIPRAALRHYDPACAVHPTLDRGAGARLAPVRYGAGWVVQCHLLRTRGVALAGPSPSTVVDAVSPDELRRAMRGVLDGWGAEQVARPAALATRGYQSYVVLTACRIRYTIATGEVASKRRAAAWVRPTVAPARRRLIDRAVEGRLSPAGPPEPAAVAETLAFVRETAAWAAHAGR